MSTKKVKLRIPLSNSTIYLERALEEIHEKGEYIAIKCLQVIVTLNSMRSTSPTIMKNYLKINLS